MPVFYHIDAFLKLAYCLGTGACTGAQFIQVSKQIYQCPINQTFRMVIIDQLTITDLDFEPSFLSQAIALLPELHAMGPLPEKIAILSFNKYTAHFADIFTFMASDITPEIRVFQFLPDALSWLGLSAVIPQVLHIRAALFANA
jgi:hypothetical protein